MLRLRVRQLLATLAVCASIFVTAPTISAMPVCNTIRAQITFEEYWMYWYLDNYFDTNNVSWLNLAAETNRRIQDLEVDFLLEGCD